MWPLSRGQIFRSLYGPVLPVLKTSNNTAKLVMALTLLPQCVAASGTEAQAEPGVAVRAWVLTDAEGGEILAGENASKRLLSSSTDKIMVVLVALRMVEAGEASLEDEITVSEDAAFAVPLYSNVGLFAGDSLSVREFLAAALIPSGTEAAYALAEHLGRGDANDFVERMNREAEALGLEDTCFQISQASTPAARARAPGSRAHYGASGRRVPVLPRDGHHGLHDHHHPGP